MQGCPTMRFPVGPYKWQGYCFKTDIIINLYLWGNLVKPKFHSGFASGGAISQYIIETKLWNEDVLVLSLGYAPNWTETCIAHSYSSSFKYTITGKLDLSKNIKYSLIGQIIIMLDLLNICAFLKHKIEN